MNTTDLKNALPLGYILNGEYAIESILGHGGFGITYLARDVALNSLVAIKEYLPQVCVLREGQATVIPKSSNDKAQYLWGLERFKQEGQMLASFNHPNIVSVMRLLGGVNNTAYLVMRYEEGQSLADYLKRYAPTLSETMIRKVFLPLLDGLRAVHKQGLLHRDIKPSNIYMRADHSPMLLDFGSARYALSEHSQSLSAVNTIGYSPPEQSGNRGQGEWTDIYSVGASIYKCMTGEPPISADERTTARLQDEADPYIPVRIKAHTNYSDHLLYAVDAALKFRAKDRSQKAREFQRLLIGEKNNGKKSVSNQQSNAVNDRPNKPQNDLLNWIEVNKNRLLIFTIAIHYLSWVLPVTKDGVGYDYALMAFGFLIESVSIHLIESFNLVIAISYFFSGAGNLLFLLAIIFTYWKSNWAFYLIPTALVSMLTWFDSALEYSPFILNNLINGYYVWLLSGILMFLYSFWFYATHNGLKPSKILLSFHALPIYLPSVYWLFSILLSK